jgi:hypothetical protein
MAICRLLARNYTMISNPAREWKGTIISVKHTATTRDSPKTFYHTRKVSSATSSSTLCCASINSASGAEIPNKWESNVSTPIIQAPNRHFGPTLSGYWPSMSHLSCNRTHLILGDAHPKFHTSLIQLLDFDKIIVDTASISMWADTV